jgi:hypothetical protein
MNHVLVDRGQLVCEERVQRPDDLVVALHDLFPPNGMSNL